jgi:hypothetical protein
MRITIICFLVLTVFPTLLPAMVLDPSSSTQSGVSASNGFFGGLVSGKLRLLQSETWGGPLYYSINYRLTVTYNGKSIAIGNLPLNTPITVTLVGGSVSSVMVTGGGN